MEQQINQKLKGKNDYIDLSQLTVIEFADLVMKKRCLKIYKEAIGNIMKFPEKAELQQATNQQHEFIAKLEEVVCSHIGVDHTRMLLDIRVSNKVYKRTAIIYNLMGWNSVFKAIKICGVDYDNGREKYPPENFSHKNIPLQTHETPLVFVFVKYKNIFTNMFVNMLTFANVFVRIRTDRTKGV